MSLEMAKRRNNGVKLINSNICRCCLKAGCNKSLTDEYNYLGQKEVYKKMLKTTFDIKVSFKGMKHIVHFVCEDCIRKLRDAANFKRMVLRNDKHYLKIIKTIQLEEEEVKLEDIKFDEDSCDEDDEVLANIKRELESDLEAAQRKDNETKKETELTKCEIKTDVGIEPASCSTAPSTSTAATVLLDHPRLPSRLNREIRKDYIPPKKKYGRGYAPLLRENSLKLLENSTIFVFQWNKSHYRCFCCKEPFSDTNLLREHTNIKHTLKEIEKRIIAQQNGLLKVEISVLKCKICDVTLDSLATLREHLINAHNMKFSERTKEDLLAPFKIGDLSCQLCTQKFSDFRNLNMHMNQHFKKQICHFCGLGFSSLLFLNLHKARMHRAIKCRQCDMKFSNNIEKKRHEIAIHNIKYERIPRFPCPHCKERFFQESVRVKHLIEKHGLKKPEFKCSVCSKSFITRSLSNNHYKTVHFKEKKQECDICHNFFYTKSDVLRHKVTHTGEKNFSCHLCHNLFANKDSVRRHMKRTHGIDGFSVGKPRRVRPQGSVAEDDPIADEDPCSVFQ